MELRRTGLWDQSENKNIKTLALEELKDEIMIKLVLMFYNFLSASCTLLLLTHCREEFLNHSIPTWASDLLLGI